MKKLINSPETVVKDALAGMALATSFVYLAPVGNAAMVQVPMPMPVAVAPSLPQVRPPRFVRVIVDPWAEIHVDGEPRTDDVTLVLVRRDS